MSVGSITSQPATQSYVEVLSQDSTHWSLYRALASHFPNSAQQSHILLKGAWHALERGEYRVVEELSNAAQNCYGKTFSARLIDLELLKRKKQETLIPQRLLEIAQVFQKKGLPSQELKAYKMLARLDPQAEYYKKVIALYHQLKNPKKASKWEASLATLREPLALQDLDGLDKRLITNEPGIIRPLSKRVLQEEAFKKKLFAIIERSKKDPCFSIAAANAITVLNAAGISFSGRDFRGVRIRGAYLPNVILDSTDLSDADMRGVVLPGGYLRNTNCARSLMEGIDFGRRPDLKGTRSAHNLIVRREKIYFTNGISIEAWNYMTGKRIFSIKENEPGGEIVCFDVSQDERWALLGSRGDCNIRLWDLRSGKLFKKLIENTDRPLCVAFFPDGRRFISASYSEGLRLWDLASGKVTRTLQGIGTNGNLTISPSGTWGASSAGDSSIQVWHLRSNQLTHTLRGHTFGIQAIAFSQDEKLMLSGSHDHTARLWDLGTGKTLQVLKGEHTWSVSSVAISPNNQLALTGSDDKTARVWDLRTGKAIQIQAHSQHVKSIAFSQDGRWALSKATDEFVGKGDDVQIWKIMPTEIRPSQTHWWDVTSLSVCMNKGWLISGSEDFTIKVWDIESGNFLQSYKGSGGDRGRQQYVDISLNGRWLVTGSRQNLMYYDLQRGALIRTIEERIYGVLLSLDGKQALTQGPTEDVKLWDLAKGQVVHTLKGWEYSQNSIAISSNGQTALTKSKDHIVRLWNLASGKIIHLLTGHKNEVKCFAFSSDDSLALTGSKETIRMWDLKAGKELKSIDCTEPDHLSFSPDAKKVIVLGNEVQLWNLENDQMVRCERKDLFSEDKVLKAVFLQDEVWVFTTDKRYSVKKYRIFEREGKLYSHLMWSSPSPLFTCQGMNIQDAQGLGPANRELLLQHTQAVKDSD